MTPLNPTITKLFLKTTFYTTNSITMNPAAQPANAAAAAAEGVIDFRFTSTDQLVYAMLDHETTYNLDRIGAFFADFYPDGLGVISEFFWSFYQQFKRIQEKKRKFVLINLPVARAAMEGLLARRDGAYYMRNKRTRIDYSIFGMFLKLFKRMCRKNASHYVCAHRREQFEFVKQVFLDENMDVRRSALRMPEFLTNWEDENVLPAQPVQFVVPAQPVQPDVIVIDD